MGYGEVFSDGMWLFQVWVPRPEPAWQQTDPLHGLESAVRARLAELGQMGFPLDRLRRLHNQFNGDEKQVSN